jgi:FkbM family methyltransferase
VKEDVLLLKVDVEGWEWSVMKGADRIFKNYKIDNVIMEYSPGRLW